MSKVRLVRFWLCCLAISATCLACDWRSSILPVALFFGAAQRCCCDEADPAPDCVTCDPDYAGDFEVTVAALTDWFCTSCDPDLNGVYIMAGPMDDSLSGPDLCFIELSDSFACASMSSAQLNFESTGGGTPYIIEFRMSSSQGDVIASASQADPWDCEDIAGLSLTPAYVNGMCKANTGTFSVSAV